MAVPTASWRTELQWSTGQYVEDYDDQFRVATAPRGRLVLLDKIQTGRPVRSNPYFWNEDVSYKKYVRLNGAISSAGTVTFTFDSGDCAFLQNGDVLVPHAT